MSPRPPANFIANSLGLDFLNSIATPVDQPIDWLDSGDGLVAWLAQAEPCSGGRAERVGEAATPGELDKVAGQARTLREWFRGFVRKHMGRPLTPTAMRELAPLNALLERDEMFVRVAAHRTDGDRLELQTTRRWRSPKSLLSRSAKPWRDACATRTSPHPGVRGPQLHADLRRPHPGSGETVVQHGGMRQSRQTSRPSPPAQGRALRKVRPHCAARAGVFENRKPSPSAMVGWAKSASRSFV